MDQLRSRASRPIRMVDYSLRAFLPGYSQWSIPVASHASRPASQLAKVARREDAQLHRQLRGQEWETRLREILGMKIEFLDHNEALNFLSSGVPVEQLVSCSNQEISWIRIILDKSRKYEVMFFNCNDDGGTVGDIYEFSPIDPDEPFGKSFIFENASAALEFCVRKLGARDGFFVKGGNIHEVYVDLVGGR